MPFPEPPNQMAAPNSDLPMFTGELERLLDSGLRVMIPKDWRSLKITEFFLISDSSSSFIKAFPRSEYDKLVAKIENDGTITEKVRNTLLEQIGSACRRARLDSAGRLPLPGELCEKIGVGTDKPEVLLTGAVRTFNIWNPAKLSTREQPQMSAKEFLGV